MKSLRAGPCVRRLLASMIGVRANGIDHPVKRRHFRIDDTLLHRERTVEREAFGTTVSRQSRAVVLARDTGAVVFVGKVMDIAQELRQPQAWEGGDGAPRRLDGNPGRAGLHLPHE